MLYLSLLVACLAWCGTSVVIDSPDTHPTGWVELGRTDPNQLIDLIFAVKQSNVDVLERTILEVSTPYTDTYGQFLSKNEIFNLVKPSAKAVIAVKEWIVHLTDDRSISEVNDITPNSDTLGFHTTVGYAESLLDCEYYNYQSKIDEKLVVSRVKIGSDYHVPTSVAGLLDFVGPTHRFPPTRHRLRRSTPEEVGAVTVDPTFLRKLYNVGDAHGYAKNNSQAVASFQDQYYSQDDLKTFWDDYNIIPCDVTNVPPDQNSGHHIEAELDTQYITAMGEGIPMQAWYTAGPGFDNALMTWTTDVLNADEPPFLFSVSYGDTETDYGLSYVTRLNQQLAMIGTRGLTVMFASGDSGAGGGCFGSNPYKPDYPASSPYVTAVGGVHGGTAGSDPIGEEAWHDAGGGFSNYAERQTWQDTAVAAYLANNKDLPNSNQWNSSGRGYPDISAQSVDFEIVVRGSMERVSGTSCASPTAAGIFALLNDLRKQNNMEPMGFLNPFIYSTAASDSTAFHDCTAGYIDGCGSAQGFTASAGWDAASGNGSPDYEVLAKHVLATGVRTRRNRN